MGKRQLVGLGGALGLLIILFTSTISVLPMRTTNGKWASDFRPYGGYIDEVLFKIYTNDSQAIEALQQGEIDAYDQPIWAKDLPKLENHPDISVSYTSSAIFRLLGLNCGRFPTNITGYRRAMAFGMDKYRATEEAEGEFATPLDSFIPTSISEWEVESQLSEHFYDADYVSGNKSLEAAGFIDLDNDGWREYDKNSNGLWDAGIDLDDNDPRLAINLTTTAGYEPAIIACTVAQEGLTKMGMRATVEELPWLELNARMDEGDFWVLCWRDSHDLYSLSPQYLFENFRTGEIWNILQFRFSNATIDSVLDKMQAATDLSDKKEYCREATKMLVYEQPAIVIYNSMTLDAYRTNKFEGFFEFKGWGIALNDYRNTKIHLKESEGGPYGGTFKLPVRGDLTHMNPLNMTPADLDVIYENVYSSLWSPDPNSWDPIPDLAHDWDIERTTANPAAGIREGTKITFYLLENATWHDGQPVTSEDVYYSFELAINHIYASIFVPSFYKKEIPDEHTFILYINETDESAWARTFGWIWPWHIWKNEVNSTDYHLLPDFKATDAHLIGSGPFKWNERVTGKYISLLRHEDWHWAVPHEPEPTTPSSLESSSKSSTPARGFELVSVFAVIVIAVAHLKCRRK